MLLVVRLENRRVGLVVLSTQNLVLQFVPHAARIVNPSRQGQQEQRRPKAGVEDSRLLRRQVLQRTLNILSGRLNGDALQGEEAYRNGEHRPEHQGDDSI